MNHPEDQLEAARELLADGRTPTEAAEALVETFGISLATAHRRVRAVRDESSWEAEPEAPEDVDYVALALATLADAIDAARAEGDWEAVASRAERLGNMAAKCRIRRAPRPAPLSRLS